jgi:uncharacterized SAM-binding protein YcdF (DUF218 family)
VNLRTLNLKRLLLCIVGGVLLVDSITLFFMGVSNFGVQVPLVLGLIFCLLSWKWPKVQERLANNRFLRGTWRLSWAIFAVWVISLLGFFALLQAQGAGDDLTGFEPQALVVLGSSTPNGQASPTLARRLDKALSLAQLYPQSLVVVSGGKDFGQTLSEAQVMGDYLRKRGLETSRIVQEEASTSTHENLLFSHSLLVQRRLSKHLCIIVTSDFHTLRASLIARRAGLTEVRTAGASTPLYLRYNAWLREYFAVISGWILKEF